VKTILSVVLVLIAAMLSLMPLAEAYGGFPSMPAG